MDPIQEGVTYYVVVENIWNNHDAETQNVLNFEFLCQNRATHAMQAKVMQQCARSGTTHS
jgi:hypothetical protein